LQKLGGNDRRFSGSVLGNCRYLCPIDSTI
jgi:hypothetical protein